MGGIVKITGGQLKGRVVQFRKHPSVRPTSSRVREALFSMLGQSLDGRTFLDAFGGSGIMGIEAYSRGAQSTVCEKDFRTASQIRKTIEVLGANIEVLSKPVPKVLQMRQWQDVFLDPPYDDNPQHWLEQMALFSTDRLVIEFHNKWKVPEPSNGFHLRRHSRYGDSCIAIYTLG